MNDLISQEYKEILEEMHESSNKWGGGPARCIIDISEFIKTYHIFYKRVLDYGCGKGKLKNVLSSLVQVTGYDPAVPEFSELPEVHDYTICVDVMEHVEKDCVDAVLEHIASVTRYKVFFVIDVEKAEFILPDGRNAHITRKTREEWITLLGKHFRLETASRGFSTLRYVGTSLNWAKQCEAPSNKWPK